jgi:hypothetical protein
MPDGTVAEFPDNTPPEVIERVRSQKTATAAQQPEKVNPFAAAAYGFGQGLTYSGLDELAAATGIADRDRAQKLQQQMRQQYPKIFGGSEIAGALLSPVPAAKFAGAGRLMRLGEQALMGGAAGGLQGTLEAQPGERLSGAAMGTAAGAALGPAIGGGVEMMRGAAGITGRALRPNAPRVASQEVLSAMSQGGLTPQSMEALIRANPPPTPFGLPMGQSGQMLAERAALGGGRAGDIVRGASEEIIGGAGARTMDIVGAATGPRQFTADILEGIKRQRDKNASELYGKARAQGAVVNDEIVAEIASDPLWRGLYRKAQQNAKRQENMTLPKLFDEKGKPIPGAYPTVASLDYLLRAGRSAKDAAFADPRQRVNAPGIKSLWDRLDTLVKQEVPEYGVARARFADDSELLKLSELGTQLMNMTESQRATALRKLAPEQQQIVKETARDALFNRLATMKDVSIASNLLSNKQTRDFLEFVSITPEAAAQAALRLRQERGLMDFARQVNPNLGSRTARSMAAQGAGVDQLATAEASTRFALGGMGERAMMIYNTLSGRLRGMTPEVREQVADMLMTVDPVQQQSIIARLSKEEQTLAAEALRRRMQQAQTAARAGRTPGLLSEEQ